MNGEQPILRGENLTRSFEEGGRLVLREVSIELYRQEFVLLMGPSGSGKSTLLAVLSGLLQPDGGKVFVRPRDEGRDLDLWALTPPERRRVRQHLFGFVFQNYNLFPALTAREQLEMAARWIDGASRAEARETADDMLSRFGLADLANKLPAQLSGGEKQRVAIGRALIKEPAICFADEPTGALDWANGEKVLQMLAATVRERQATVVVVAHDERIIPFAHRVFRMEDGCLTLKAADAAHASLTH